MLLGSCKDVHRLVAESLDHPLPFWQRTQMRLHLMACDACRAFKTQLIWLSRALRRLDGD
jgi:hypothetical protein